MPAARVSDARCSGRAACGRWPGWMDRYTGPRGLVTTPELALPGRRGRELARGEGGLPPPRDGGRERPADGRFRPRGEPLVEPRPVAARAAALPAAVPPIHGESRALLVPARSDHQRRWRLQGAPWRAGRGGAGHGCSARARGECRRDVPGGNAAKERDAEEARGSLEDGRRSDRADCRRPVGARRDIGDGAARAAGPASSRIWEADPDRRSRSPLRWRRGTRRDGPASRRDHRAGAESRVRPLLVIDGDSFTHRAYHALPKSMRRDDDGPANALTGFSDMLLRLWRAERPRAVLVGWDRLDIPTYRHEALAAYQSGRVFEEELLEQLALLPVLVEAAGFASAKAPGYEADDFLAAGATREEAAGGTALVATSDRDAFQLVSDRVTVLQPAKGGPARIGPAEVRERYGVDPSQVPDFIALRGDPSDRIPGARGIGPKRGAELLAQYGSLDAMLAEGRFASEADALRLYRHIATMDRDAPLPPLPDVAPDWRAAAAHANELGAPGVARRFEEALTWT